MGWLPWVRAIKRTADHYVESNYINNTYDSGGGVYKEASWYHYSWWSQSGLDWEWARIYENDGELPIRVSSIAFHACAGHSNGKSFWGGAGLLSPVAGGGCTFTSDIYVVDANNRRVSEKKGVGNVTVPSINQYNCWYNGVYGQVSTNNSLTSFGDPNLFGPGTGHEVPNGYRAPRTIKYTDAPEVPVGGKMFVVVRPTSWVSTNSLLVIKGSSEEHFTSVIEPVDLNYVWVCKQNPGDATPKWYKEKKAFVMNNNKKWEEM